jgi:ABC-type antimicrobial peptide transport system permease subunit
VVSTYGDPVQLAGQVREQLRALDKDLPPAGIRSMRDLVDETTSARRFEMLLLTGLAAIAVLLAAAGIYAQLAYSVSQRMSEIGLRMALGASPVDVVRMILGQGLGLALAGAVAGVGGAFALTRLLERFLFGVKPLDPVTMVLAPLSLLLVATIACLFPAWRASQADPAVALHHD